jgi:hypothetical protein
MLIFSIGQFSFTVPNRMNFYEGNQWKNWNNKSSPTISMPLDLNAYTNTKYRFTFHAPNGWTKDESGKDNSIVMFATPETLGKNNKGEPIQARIIATVMTLPSTVTLDQFIDVLNKQNAQEKMFRPVALKTIPIEGGVFTAKTLEFVNDEKGVVSHALTYLIQRGNTNTIYVIGGQAPESKWKDYEPIIHDSLRTFTLY